MKSRSPFLDGLRGVAVIWMVIFHFCYDLKMYHYIDWDFKSGFWFGFPRVIAWTFLFCVGISLHFVHAPKINTKALKSRTLKLGMAAAAVSLGTYLIMPQGWVFFGTLHCILAGSVLGTLLVNHRKVAGAFMCAIVYLQYVADYDIKWVSSVIKKPSIDFIPIYPWFWVILLGILAGPYLSKSRHLNNFEVPKGIKFLGTHSLKIYLIHQPLFFGVLWLTKAFV